VDGYDFVETGDSEVVLWVPVEAGKEKGL